jgi:hypothetical protein
LVADRSIGQNCDAITDHGLASVRTKYGARTAIALKWRDYCGFQYADESDEKVSKAHVRIFGQGAGGANKSRQQKATEIKQWCDRNQEIAIEDEEAVEEASDFYAPAVAAWSKCNELKAREFMIEPDLTSSEVVVVTLQNPGGDLGVPFYGIEKDGFAKCDVRAPQGGSVPENLVRDRNETGGWFRGDREAIVVRGIAVQVTCWRSKTEEKEGVERLERAHLVVLTGAGNLTLPFPEERISRVGTDREKSLDERTTKLEDGLKALALTLKQEIAGVDYTFTGDQASGCASTQSVQLCWGTTKGVYGGERWSVKFRPRFVRAFARPPTVSASPTGKTVRYRESGSIYSLEVEASGFSVAVASHGTRRAVDHLDLSWIAIGRPAPAAQ